MIAVAIYELTEQRLQAESVIKREYDTWEPRTEVVRQAEAEKTRLENLLLWLRENRREGLPTG